MSLYNLRMIAPNKYQMAKFDEDFNVAAIYDLEPKGHSYTCNCPANNRMVITKPCRHKKMLPFMLGAVNSDRFYDPETHSWHQPLGDILGEAPGSPLPEPIEPPLIQGTDRTATQVDEDARKAYEPVQRSAEAIIEPIVERVHAAATTLSAPILRRR